MSEREAALLRKTASDLRGRGETSSAEQLEAAADRITRRTATSDLEGLRAGVFQMRDTDESPKPRPPGVRSDGPVEGPA